MSRFRQVVATYKADGSPVTEADRAAEQAIRDVLNHGDPDAALAGEELGIDALGSPGRVWLIDPIDGTLSYARGIPLFATLITLLEDNVPTLGLIDLPALGERYVGWRGGGCFRGNVRLKVSQRTQLKDAMIAHGDLEWFEQAGASASFGRLSDNARFLRGYTDAFGHAQVLSGAVDAMVDLSLNPWDIRASPGSGTRSRRTMQRLSLCGRKVWIGDRSAKLGGTTGSSSGSFAAFLHLRPGPT